MRAPKGFTLIELLVVIAIIAILAGLLLPALTRAKQKSREVVDLSNLKQFGMAINLVASANDDVMPWPNWFSGEVTNHQQGWLYALDPSASGTAQFKAETGSFWPILTNPKLYMCPSDDTNSALFKLRGQQISSYVMNGAVCGYGRGQYPGCRNSGQLSPGGRGVWGMRQQYHQREPATLFNDGASSPDENTSARHGKLAIYEAFDGGARLMNLAAWQEKAGEPIANELWCYPSSDNGR